LAEGLSRDVHRARNLRYGLRHRRRNTLILSVDDAQNLCGGFSIQRYGGLVFAFGDPEKGLGTWGWGLGQF
jgi:hypothetical protein